MYKILISQSIDKLLQEKDSLLSRQDITTFVTNSNDETLKIHLAEHVNLIIAELDMPGMTNEVLYSMIRKSPELKQVAIIIICPNNIKSIERCSRCMADAVIMQPLDPALILAKAQYFLDLSLRETTRIRASVQGKASFHGNPVDTTLSFWAHNISSTGAFLETESILSRGDQIVCSFILSDGTQVQVEGEIVRTVYDQPRSPVNQYGIRFFNLTTEARQTLERFINGSTQ